MNHFRGETNASNPSFTSLMLLNASNVKKLEYPVESRWSLMTRAEKVNQVQGPVGSLSVFSRIVASSVLGGVEQALCSSLDRNKGRLRSIVRWNNGIEASCYYC